MRTILAAIDFSRPTELVIAEAARLARALHARVVLVTVLIEPVYLSEYAPPPRRIAKITVEHERGVRQRLFRVQEQLEKDFITTQVDVRRGNAALGILAAAKAHDATMIVIGSHGRSAFLDLILGSTAQAVLKRATVPVAVVPPKMATRRRAKWRIVQEQPAPAPTLRRRVRKSRR